MRRFLLILAAGLLLALGSLVAQAQSPDPARDAIATILNGQPVPAEMFDQSFLDVVPIGQLNAIVSQTLALTGPPESIIAVADGYLVRTVGYEMRVQISLNGAGKIIGLFFHAPVGTSKDVATLLNDLKALPGKTSYLVLKDGEVLHAHNETEPLAVGSAFKLGVLAVLSEDIAAGERAWDDVVRLEARQVSLPSGTLHTFPIGAPFTLHTLAALMISVSDNTATDILIDTVGRERVAAKLGIDFVLKTRELFMLKQNEALRDRFIAADAASKLAMVPEMDATPVAAIGAGANDPLTDGVEWYVPVTTLCALMAEVAARDVMQISPGLANKADWQTVSYKGGSEVGVLNMTTGVTAQDGTTYCVSFSWNDSKALAEASAFSTYASLLSRLSRE
jgi:hypothetical protein